MNEVFGKTVSPPPTNFDCTIESAYDAHSLDSFLGTEVFPVNERVKKLFHGQPFVRKKQPPRPVPLEDDVTQKDCRDEVYRVRLNVAQWERIELSHIHPKAYCLEASDASLE